jgi:hypothetical protein
MHCDEKKSNIKNDKPSHFYSVLVLARLGLVITNFANKGVFSQTIHLT